MQKNKRQLIIIGGGAAGFFAAIRVAELCPEASVILLEKGKEVLGKVKISGGGRCNVTHACFDPGDLIKHYPRGEKELLGPFHRFACSDTAEWFEKRGVSLKVEEDGRLFPVTDSSQTIIDCLVGSAREAGVHIRMGCRVDDLIPPSGENPSWQVITPFQVLQAEKVMVATGSNSRIWAMLERLGHTIVPPVPSLFTFNIRDTRISGLEGISVPSVKVKIPSTKLEAEGPLLITHWGMSGPAILKLSAWGARILAEYNYWFNIQVNWINQPLSRILGQLEEIKKQHPKKLVITGPFPSLSSRLWRRLAEAAVTPEKRWADTSKSDLDQLASQLGNASFQVNGKSTFKEEFVTAGGVDLKEVDFKTFQSKRLPGLFLAGEVLNIDAITGGFNFQAAWTGGWIAAEGMAERPTV